MQSSETIANEVVTIRTAMAGGITACVVLPCAIPLRICRPRCGGALPVMAPAFAQVGLLPGAPRPGQLGDQPAQAAARDPRTDMTAQGRAGPFLRICVRAHSNS